MDWHYRLGIFPEVIDQEQVVNGHYQVVIGQYQVIIGQYQVVIGVPWKSWSHKNMILVTKRVVVAPFELKLGPNESYGRAASV